MICFQKSLDSAGKYEEDNVVWLQTLQKTYFALFIIWHGNN